MDKTFSIDIKQLKELKEITSKIYSSLGKPIIGPKKNEISSLKFRRSIFAIKDIKKGEKFTSRNLGIKRPGHGISPMKFFRVIGKIAKKNFSQDELIKLWKKFVL